MPRLRLSPSTKQTPSIQDIVNTFIAAHKEVYGEAPTVNLNDFKDKFTDLQTAILAPNGVQDTDYKDIFISYFIYNKETNQAPYNNKCSIQTMTSSHAYHTGWYKVLENKQMNNNEKIGNNNNINIIKSYYNIDEYEHYIYINTGIDYLKILKSECRVVTIGACTCYIPKDMRLRSHYDYQSLLNDLGQTHSEQRTLPRFEKQGACYGYHVCSDYPVQCSLHCMKYKKLSYLLSASDIPKRYLKPVDFIDFVTMNDALYANQTLLSTLIDLKLAIDDYVQEGTSFVFYSKDKGNGKTSWAIALGRYLIFNRLKSNRLVPEVYFVSVPDYFTLLKNSFSHNDLRDDVLEMQNLMKDVPLLIFDDLGAEKPSDFVREQLYAIINYRYMNELSTIYTTNLDIHSEQAKDMLGSRVISRIRDSILVQF